MALGYLLHNQVATVLVIAVYTTGIEAVLIVVAPSFGRFLSGGAQLSLLHDPELTMPLPTCLAEDDYRDQLQCCLTDEALPRTVRVIGALVCL
ncbi:hypothetical protein [Streptomyces xanthochromogenes]|uniref:hypothetical protein n=1 Tax=Streptomyces xanthochromogenes TaxID=67384 RepID=UPI003416C42F